MAKVFIRFFCFIYFVRLRPTNPFPLVSPTKKRIDISLLDNLVRSYIYNRFILL